MMVKQLINVSINLFRTSLLEFDYKKQLNVECNLHYLFKAIFQKFDKLLAVVPSFFANIIFFYTDKFEEV